MVYFSKCQQEIIRNIIDKTKYDSKEPYCLGDTILLDECKKIGVYVISRSEDWSSVSFHSVQNETFLKDIQKIYELLALFVCLENNYLAFFHYGKGYGGENMDIRNSNIVKKENIYSRKIYGDYCSPLYPNTFHTDLGRMIFKFANASIYPTHSLIKLCEDNFKTTEQKTLNTAKKTLWATWLLAIVAILTMILSPRINTESNNQDEVTNETLVMQSEQSKIKSEQ